MINRDSASGKFIYLYIDGFKQMTLGRTLWAIIIIKLLLVFGIIKFFFFPNILKERAPGREADYVAGQIENRAASRH